jgi:hypothetical protein
MTLFDILSVDGRLFHSDIYRVCNGNAVSYPLQICANLVQEFKGKNIQVNMSRSIILEMLGQCKQIFLKVSKSQKEGGESTPILPFSIHPRPFHTGSFKRYDQKSHTSVRGRMYFSVMS